MIDPLPAPSATRSPLDEVDLHGRVQRALAEFLEEQAAVLAKVGPECDALVASISRLVSGGKRLRPAFCYWGWRGAGRDDDERVVRAAAALELFQAAALIHDDVMDRSDTRRGMPAVHQQFAALHAQGRWTGSAARFGDAAAVLAGDLCLGWSDEMLAGSGLATTALERGKPVFDRMRTELMAGQFLDVVAQASPASVPSHGEGDVDRALRVVRFKSAKYSVEHPLLLGAAFAGAEPDLVAAYSAFGLPLGEAFQLRDDVLGVFGDPAETGKPAGDDLREGKRTVLVALAHSGADAGQASLLAGLLGRPDLTRDGVDDLREVIAATGALAAVEEMIDERVRRSLAALEDAAVAPPARAAFLALVGAATARVA